MDPRLFEIIQAERAKAAQAGESFQQAPLQAFGALMKALDELPKQAGLPYSISEATESLPPPGALGPAAPAGAALGGFGKLLGAAGSIGVLPGRGPLARAINKRGLRGPWFHGTKAARDILPTEQGGPQTIQYLRSRLENPSSLQGWPQDTIDRMWRDLHYLESGKSVPPTGGGFSLDKLGAETGTRLGEPSGVSLTRDPEVARTFGDILRVGVDVPPSSVGEFVDPQFQRLFQEAYHSAGKLPANPRPNWGSTPVPEEISLSEALKVLPQEPNLQQFNNAMTSHLRSKGVEAIRYNPKRWNEFELRVLDPEKAVPLGVISNSGLAPEASVWSRYRFGQAMPDENIYEPLEQARGGLLKLLKKQLQDSPDFPARLHDLIKEVQD